MRGALVALAATLAAPAALAAHYRHPSECREGCMVVTAYYDHGGVSDWSCGSNTYGGHRGTDFGIFGGFAAVDEGRPVVAAAAGVVVQANDGEFDRCTTGNCAGGGGFGNYVAIQHDDGVVTFYGHMRQGSVAAGVGDVVTCGQFLGFIASSGASTGPHVHFEPRAAASIDPFAGACNGPTSLWVEQGDYDGLPGATCEGPANQAPRGYLDVASCDEGVAGWAQDLDAPDAAIDVQVSFDGDAGSGARAIPVVAGGHRDDLCTALGSCNHGFALPIPKALRDGAPHTAFARGIDTAGGDDTLLTGSPRSFTCDPPALPDGVLRHIGSPAVMAAWGFSFDDVAPYASLDRDEAGGWPAAPSLVRDDRDGAIYLVDDGGVLRHVQSPASMAAWHFSFDGIPAAAPDDVDGAVHGPDLPLAPALVRVAGAAAVSVVDAAPLPPDDPTADPPGDTGTPPDAGSPPVTPPSSTQDPSATTTAGRGDGGRHALASSVAGGCAATPPALFPAALLLLLARRRRHSTMSHAASSPTTAQVGRAGWWNTATRVFGASEARFHKDDATESVVSTGSIVSARRLGTVASAQERPSSSFSCGSRRRVPRRAA